MLSTVPLFDTAPTDSAWTRSLVPASGISLKSARSVAVLMQRKQPVAAKDARTTIPPLENRHKELQMNWDIAKGNWKQFKGQVQAQWGKLTDDHFDVIAGKREELVGKIQESYGISRDEAEKQVKDFESQTRH